MRQLTENKDRFIDKNPNLTFEQAQEVKKFFNTHNEAEALMGNWQNDSDKWTYDDFKKVMYDYEHRNTKSNANKIANRKGIDGIELGYDYLDLGEYTTESWGTFHAYSPLTHLGAKTLAGPQVPPVQKDKDSAAWCIGYSGDGYYWNERCSKGGYDDYFIIICGKKVPTLKVCLEIPYRCCWTGVYVWDYYDDWKYLGDNDFLKKDRDIIINLIEYAREQGAYDKRVFDEGGYDSDGEEVFSGESFADLYYYDLNKYFNECERELIEEFGEEEVFNAMDECDWAVNPLTDLTEEVEVIYYDSGRFTDGEIYSEIELMIHEFFEEIRNYILDHKKEED